MSESTSNSRRNWLIAAGVGAAAVGVGVSLLRKPAAPPPLSAAAASFWAGRFDRPDGGELLAAEFKGRPLLLNFWATWCPPCIKELPELAQFQQEFKARGWQVLGLAVDSPSAVREFLKKLPLDMAVGLAGLTGTELTRTLGNTQGGLPFSVAFDASGELIWRKLGVTNLVELRQMAAKLTPG
ncbi:TlpA disulfide reductase family protein [Roseateles sp.]|uniref:TlpA family protein disulfide reductase n=1 Tax=Roseateles sp. TaxID=1971397 RepID=UPI00286A8EB1|nr:TlpA disulfide reductase family protein [Roseateles sp.]